MSWRAVVNKISYSKNLTLKIKSYCCCSIVVHLIHLTMLKQGCWMIVEECLELWSQNLRCYVVCYDNHIYQFNLFACINTKHSYYFLANTNRVNMLNVIKLITALFGPLYTRNSQSKKILQYIFFYSTK